MIPVSNHNCTTQFADGVNIFVMSQHFLKAPCKQKKFIKAESIGNSPFAPQDELVAILKTGSYTITALSEKLKITPPAIYQRVMRLVKHGIAKRVRSGMAHEYTFGKPKGVTFTVVEQIMNLLKKTPDLTSGEIAKRLVIGNATNHLSRLYANGTLVRRNNNFGIYIYRLSNAEVSGLSTRPPC